HGANGKVQSMQNPPIDGMKPLAMGKNPVFKRSTVRHPVEIHRAYFALCFGYRHLTRLIAQLHQYKSACVPKLIAKCFVTFDAVKTQLDVSPLARHCSQGKSKGIGPILSD